MMDLTVIIPFLNEGIEIENTVKNVRLTAKNHLNILLINDGSNDGYDYDTLTEKYDVQMVKHSKRHGVAASRDEAVNLINTEYFVLLDGHMRFFKKGWDELLLKHLSSDSRTIWCGRTRSIKKDENGEIIWDVGANTFGAYIKLADCSWKIKWSYYDPKPYEDVIDIPCVLGACYSAAKTYWQHLGGLNGLMKYGVDEQFISVKAWLEGGACRLIWK